MFSHNPDYFMTFRTYDEKYVLKDDTIKQLELHINNIISLAKKNYASYFNISKNAVSLTSIKESSISVEEWARKDFKKLADEVYSMRIPSYYLNHIR
tara:strand:- start:762 stop:1052 length:291 start_codon:yes stop_codon:yes gene_type:complete